MSILELRCSGRVFDIVSHSLRHSRRTDGPDRGAGWSPVLRCLSLATESTEQQHQQQHTCVLRVCHRSVPLCPAVSLRWPWPPERAPTLQEWNTNHHQQFTPTLHAPQQLRSRSDYLSRVPSPMARLSCPQRVFLPAAHALLPPAAPACIAPYTYIHPRAWSPGVVIRHAGPRERGAGGGEWCPRTMHGRQGRLSSGAAGVCDRRVVRAGGPWCGSLTRSDWP